MTASTLKDYVASRPARERKAIEIYTHQLRAEMALNELRASRKVTQAAVAKALKTSQGEVSRIEKRDDMHLSTIKGFVEGLGGKVGIVALFPGEEPIPLTFGKGAATQIDSHRTQTPKKRVVVKFQSAGEKRAAKTARKR